MATKRTRNFATVIYEDSTPENWLDILTDLHIPCFVSPLHDKDVKEDGSPKKPHRHVQFMFDGVKTVDQVQKIISNFNGVGCEVLESVRGYARYLCHLDNPEKAKYSISDVIELAGADYHEVIRRMTDKSKALSEMQDYIDENDIDSFYELASYSRNFRSDWYDCLINNGSYFIKEYIKSRTWKLHNRFEE